VLRVILLVQYNLDADNWRAARRAAARIINITMGIDDEAHRVGSVGAPRRWVEETVGRLQSLPEAAAGDVLFG